jgi:hypothetical protein
MTLYEAIKEHGWKIYQFNFTDNTSQRIASFISTDVTQPAATFLISNGKIAQPINDESSNFSYEIFFKKVLVPPIEDVTKEYITN